MKEIFLQKSINLIKKNNPSIDYIKIEEIKYGLEGLYMAITKFIAVLTIAFIFDIVKEFIIFFLLYNVIRFFAFGVHAKKTSICCIMSIILFVCLPLLMNSLILHVAVKIVVGLFCLLSMILYAPADTYQRPILSANKRNNLKFVSIAITAIYLIISVYNTSPFWSSVFLLAIFLESILILPITYKLFKSPYNNYRNYN